MHALGRIQQHAAGRVMRQAGIRKRRDAKTPIRVPRRAITSLNAQPDGGAEPGPAIDVPDPAAHAAFDEVERRIDMETVLAALSADERRLFYDCFQRDVPRADVAARLGVTDRTVRERLENLYARLRALYLHGKEDDHVQ